MTQRKAHNPPWPWAEKFRISQAVQVGDTVYVSGQGPLDPQGNLVGEGDMAARCMTPASAGRSETFTAC